METGITSKRGAVGTIIIAVIFVSISILQSYLNNETKVVFCDVGQGDATYIRIYNKIDILIDAGPDRKVLQCLGKYMPFFDKTIELAILSHPQKDHFGGFEHILERYKITLFILNPINNSAISFQSLIKKLQINKVTLESKYTGDIIKISDYKITFYWPTKSYLASNIYKNEKRTSQFILSNPLVNLNKYSYVLKFENKNTSILFTGDIDKEISNKISNYLPRFNRGLGHINILKVPHHGSKNGATKKFIEKIKPNISIISVGKNNSYGHPSSDILGLLNNINSIIKRTDINGDIIIKL